MYYPTYPYPSAPPQYYYAPTQSGDMTPYYYHPTTPTYSNSQQPYAYGHSAPYYNASASYGTAYYNNEQFNYYYNQQASYAYEQQNSTNDIPLSNDTSIHRSYEQMNSNIQR